MNKKFKRKIDSLADIFSFVAEFISQNDLDDSNAFSLNLAVEELFTNMVKYNPENPDPINIDLESTAKSIILEITDKSLMPFDINKAAEYDDTLSLKERPIGGVGIHLIKKIFDEINYEYKGNNNIITLVKIL